MILVVTSLVAAAGCDKTPTAATPPETITETFSGTMRTRQTDDYQFAVKAQGGVTIILTAVQLETPPDDGTMVVPPVIGLGVGIWNGTACSRVAENKKAVPGTIVAGTALAGQFCASVFDPDGSSVTDPLTYTVTVTHP